MHTQHPLTLALASALAIALTGVALSAGAQTATQPGATQFERGTESTVTFPMANGKGTVTLHSGMPAHVKHYGPPPAFAKLDTNRNGRISEREARAYPPLDNDFLFASKGGKFVTKAAYRNWTATQH